MWLKQRKTCRERDGSGCVTSLGGFNRNAAIDPSRALLNKNEGPVPKVVP